MPVLGGHALETGMVRFHFFTAFLSTNVYTHIYDYRIHSWDEEIPHQIQDERDHASTAIRQELEDHFIEGKGLPRQFSATLHEISTASAAKFDNKYMFSYVQFSNFLSGIGKEVFVPCKGP